MFWVNPKSFWRWRCFCPKSNYLGYWQCFWHRVNVRFSKKCADKVCSEELIWKNTKLKYHKNTGYICPKFMNHSRVILKIVTQFYEKRQTHSHRSYFQFEILIFVSFFIGLPMRILKFLKKVELRCRVRHLKSSSPPIGLNYVDWVVFSQKLQLHSTIT